MHCLGDELLQRRFDGELAAAELAAANAHLSLCSICARAARDLESEAAILDSALVAICAVSVPTLQLQARLQSAVNLKETDSSLRASASSRFRDLRTLTHAIFAARPGLNWGAAAAALAAVLIATVYLASQNSNNVRISDIAVEYDFVGPVPLRAARDAALTGGRGESLANPVNAANYQLPVKAFRSRSQPEARVRFLPGEKSYLKAIISLEYTFQAQGDLSLRPEVRVEYERNLAVVDEAIVTTRAAAMRDPLDADASSMLLSAYQSKVDLMSAVMTGDGEGAGAR